MSPGGSRRRPRRKRSGSIRIFHRNPRLVVRRGWHESSMSMRAPKTLVAEFQPVHRKDNDSGWPTGGLSPGPQNAVGDSRPRSLFSRRSTSCDARRGLLRRSPRAYSEARVGIGSDLPLVCRADRLNLADELSLVWRQPYRLGADVRRDRATVAAEARAARCRLRRHGEATASAPAAAAQPSPHRAEPEPDHAARGDRGGARVDRPHLCPDAHAAGLQRPGIAALPMTTR